jgi:hypothetical protein
MKQKKLTEKDYDLVEIRVGEFQSFWGIVRKKAYSHPPYKVNNLVMALVEIPIYRTALWYDRDELTFVKVTKKDIIRRVWWNPPTR